MFWLISTFYTLPETHLSDPVGVSRSRVTKLQSRPPPHPTSPFRYPSLGRDFVHLRFHHSTITTPPERLVPGCVAWDRPLPAPERHGVGVYSSFTLGHGQGVEGGTSGRDERERGVNRVCNFDTRCTVLQVLTTRLSSVFPPTKDLRTGHVRTVLDPLQSSGNYPGAGTYCDPGERDPSVGHSILSSLRPRPFLTPSVLQVTEVKDPDTASGSFHSTEKVFSLFPSCSWLKD